MLDGEDDNFPGPIVGSVIDQIWIAPRHQLSHALDLCCRPICGNKTKLWSDSKIAARTRSAACGLCSRTWSAMPARSRAARGVKRSFIARSDGTRLRPRHRLRIVGAWLAQALPARREDAQDRSPLVRLMAAEGQHGERDFVLAIRRQSPHGFQGFFEQFCHETKIRSNRSKWKGIRQTSDFAGIPLVSLVCVRACTTRVAPCPQTPCQTRPSTFTSKTS